MFFDDDTEFICNDIFSDENIVITNNDTNFTTRGIFDKTYSEFNPDTGMTIMSRNPRVTFYENTLLEYMDDINDIENWIITIRNVDYKTKKPQPDGTGLVVCYLKK